MKKSRRIHGKDSTPSTSLKHQMAADLTASQAAPSPDQIKARIEMRQRKINSPLSPGLAGLWSLECSDALAVDCLALSLEPFVGKMRQIVGSWSEVKSGENSGPIAQLCEALVAIRAAARRARYNGLKSAPSVRDEREGRGRAPLLLDFAGYSGLLPVSDPELLFLIGSTIYRWREAFERLFDDLPPEQSVELYEALYICELATDRGEGLEHVEKAQAEGEPTELQRRAQAAKAKYLLADFSTPDAL